LTDVVEAVFYEEALVKAASHLRKIEVIVAHTVVMGRELGGLATVETSRRVVEVLPKPVLVWICVISQQSILSYRVVTYQTVKLMEYLQKACVLPFLTPI
jgi:hypothetical protein